MKRRVLSLFLCALLLTALVSCGASEPAPAAAAPETAAPAAATPAPAATEVPAATPEPTPAAPEPGVSYREAYMKYLSIFTALSEEIERRVEVHNALLETAYPDTYYMNSNYLMQVVTPYRTAYPAFGALLSDDSIDAAAEALRAYYPDVQLTLNGPGSYEAVYTYVDKTSGAEVMRQGRCVWECDGAAGSFRVRAYVDDALVEFAEFVPQGGGRYLLYSGPDKILVAMDGDSVAGFAFARMINAAPLGAFGGDMRLNSLDAADFFPDGTAEEDWIVSDPDAEFVLVLKNGEATYTGKVSQDVLNGFGEKTDVYWLDIDPIELLQ